MIRIAALATAIVLGAAAGQPATAQGLGPAGRVDFAQIDADGDGQITRAEAQAYRDSRMGERFATIDRDGDGAVSREELQTAPAARFAARMLDRFDADGNGSISEAELLAGAAARREARQGDLFDRLDGDANGVVTQEEFAEMRDARGRHGWGRRLDGQGGGLRN